jgi:hypothetical protein
MESFEIGEVLGIRYRDRVWASEFVKRNGSLEEIYFYFWRFGLLKSERIYICFEFITLLGH